MTKNEAHDLKPGERLLKVTHEHYKKIIFAVDQMQRLMLQSMEANHKKYCRDFAIELNKPLIITYKLYCDLENDLKDSDV